VTKEDELKAEIADLHDRLHRAQAELREIKLAAMPFHAGDIVEVLIWRRRGGGVSGGPLPWQWQAAIVRSVSTWGPYKVSLRKKDGTWSKAERHAGITELRPFAVVGNTGNVLQ
jgi:hypothetical protein